MSDNWFVLIVEDRQDWQQIIVKNLKGLPCTIDVAGDYDDAIALLKEKYYHLVIIDPVLDTTNRYNRDGIRILTEVYEHSPQTHLIVVSGSISDTTLKEASTIPKRLPLVEKSSWDRITFKTMVQQILANQENKEQHPPQHGRLFNGARDSQELELPTLPQELDRRGAPRVLIVEDRADWQVILTRIVEEEGWFWRICTDAQEALRMVQTQTRKFNVVLLDLRLGDAEVPIHDGEGWRLLDYLNKYEPRTKVVIVSGEATRGDVAELFMEHTIFGFIDKDTFEKEDLVRQLRTLVARPTLEIHTLGAFEIRRNEKIIDTFEHPLAEEFIKILLTRKGDMVTFDELTDILSAKYYELDDELQNLNSIANAARFALEPNLIHPSDSAFIVRHEAAYGFDFSRHLIVDFEKLESILREGKHHEREGAYARAMKVYEASLSLYRGEYLPINRSDQWTIGMRSDLQSTFVRILNRLADLYARDRRMDDAISAALLSIQQDAYHESTYRRLMRYYACNGDAPAALRLFHTLEKLLKEFFEEEPIAATRRLKESIEQGKEVPCIERLS